MGVKVGVAVSVAVGVSVSVGVNVGGSGVNVNVEVASSVADKVACGAFCRQISNHSLREKRTDRTCIRRGKNRHTVQAKLANNNAAAEK